MDYTAVDGDALWHDLRLRARSLGMTEADLMLMCEEAERLLQEDCILARHCSTHRLVCLGMNHMQNFVENDGLQ